VGEAGELVAVSPGRGAADIDAEVPQSQGQALATVGHDVVGQGGEKVARRALRITQVAEVVGEVAVGDGAAGQIREAV
jgi:hypothetical protein